MAAGLKTGGRKAGTRNKVTAGAKANIMRVFDDIGGVKNFARWAQENETEFYRHYAKLVPLEVVGDEENPITLISKIERVIVSPKDKNG